MKKNGLRRPMALFPQSMVREHTELMWILACHTPLGWLNRMTQFKEKAGKQKDQANLGLYSYPVLMAADILLYKPTNVPVGEDQKQHVEITRDIAGAFNRCYETNTFIIPEFSSMGPATRVMSLRDGTSKMSKSDRSEASRLHLKDTTDEIIQKIKKAKTDSGVFPSTFKEAEGRPEVQNLINIYCALTDSKPGDLYTRFGGHNFSPFKEALAEVCVSVLSPIREQFHHLMKDKKHLDTIIQHGTEKARTIAEKTMKEVREVVGLTRNV
jgi:tryptophanyl-tRNA synthetase